MQSALRIDREDIEPYLYEQATSASLSAVVLPSFPEAGNKRSARITHNRLTPMAVRQPTKPQLALSAVPAPNADTLKSTRKIPFLVQANRTLRTLLVALCGTAILGYGLDVAASNDVGNLEEQARRLNEQNSELSAKLLKAISYQDIQKSVTGLLGLCVPDHVVIVSEVPPPKVPTFIARKHQLPVMSGY